MSVKKMSAKKRSLTPYQRKRHFSKTAEPKGKIKKRTPRSPLFVIQKHAASHLHFDFRIEVGGVLVSWAVPKSITTNPAEKHLAVPTEDHPLEYAHFEGIIPVGEYGGGTVMVWDIGTYQNIKKIKNKTVSMEQCLQLGRIEIFLEGKKLKGGYALIRTKRDKEVYWLLVKMRDDYANKRITNVTKSALSGKTMKQIADSGVTYV